MLIPIGLYVFRLKRGLETNLNGIFLMTFAPLLALGVSHTTTKEFFTLTDQHAVFGTGSGTDREVRFEEWQRFEFKIKKIGFSRRGTSNDFGSPCFILKDGTEVEVGNFVARGEVVEDLIARLNDVGCPLLGTDGEIEADANNVSGLGMKRLLTRLYNLSPNVTLRYLGARLQVSMPNATGDANILEMVGALKKRFEVYQSSNLKGIAPEVFKNAILSRIGVVDAQVEGYSEDEIDQQRDMSIKFYWGHNHDFGDFKLDGQTGDRHINLLANFIVLFPVTLEDFQDKYVFDVGCWTGGTTLVLAMIANKVYAIEEVKKYSETAAFLSDSFGISSRVSVKASSIYDCNTEELENLFDIVYFPGVIYHLSDPLLALRILYNSLKIGGFILVESAGINMEEPYCRFDGSMIHHSGTKERLNRRGWNWFMPSPSALYCMMKEAGFDEIQTKWHDGTDRVYGYGKKVSQVGICKAGLSVPNIK